MRVENVKHAKVELLINLYIYNGFLAKLPQIRNENIVYRT